MQRSVKFSAKLNNLIAGISDRITQQNRTTCRAESGVSGVWHFQQPLAGVGGVARLLSATPRQEAERERETLT